MKELLRNVAYEELEGIGSAPLGQWEEIGHIAFHLRRRLTALEQLAVGPVIDIRNTPEADWRFSKVAKFWPKGMPIQ